MKYNFSGISYLYAKNDRIHINAIAAVTKIGVKMAENYWLMEL